MSDIIPVLNGGSSSLKFSIFEVAEDQSLSLRLTGQIEGLGRSLDRVRLGRKVGGVASHQLLGFIGGYRTLPLGASVRRQKRSGSG